MSIQPEENKQGSLVDKFIENTYSHDLFPLVYGSTLFSFRISSRIDGGYYQCSRLAPYIIIAGDNETVIQTSEFFLKKAGLEFFEKFLSNKNILTESADKINKYLSRLKEIYNKLNYEDIKKAEIDSLVVEVREAYEINRAVATLNWYTFYFNEEFCGKLFKELNEQINNEKFKNIYTKAIIPAFPSFNKRHYWQYLDLIFDGYTRANLAEKCQYFYADYSTVDGNLEQVSEKLKKDFGEVSKEEAEKIKVEEVFIIKNEEKEFASWLASLNKQEAEMVEYIQHLMWLRDIRKDVTSLTLTIFYKVAQRIFEEAKMPESLINLCYSDEILKGVDYLINHRQEIEKRANGFAMLCMVDSDDEPETEIVSYEVVKEKLVKNYERKFLQQEHLEIKGQTAYGGKIRGRVKIILSYSSDLEFKDGDILVTGMTRPEFIPLMKQASAIITDEGGIACHASIVSRELHKPCIVGTKIATQVLHDGDEVEVDADKGVVKIIKGV